MATGLWLRRAAASLVRTAAAGGQAAKWGSGLPSIVACDAIRVKPLSSSVGGFRGTGAVVGSGGRHAWSAASPQAGVSASQLAASRSAGIVRAFGGARSKAAQGQQQLSLSRRQFSSQGGDGPSSGAATQEGHVSKFKKMFKKYGPLFVGFYGGLYVTTLGAMYICVDYNVFSKDTKNKILELKDQYDELLKKLGLDGLFSHDKFDGKATSFAIAWIATKLTEPLRFAISVYTVPKLARFLAYRRA